MIRRTFLGLDITAGGLRAVALRRRGKGAVLAGGRILPLPEGVLAPSMKEANIRDIRRLAEGIREVLDPLAGREERIALSLPESSGRVLLTEVETPFKSRAEGLEILKWQLKGNLPVDPRDMRLDYQILGRRETGRYRVVASVMAEKILGQYEEILAGLGYFPRVIDFHTLHMYNYYHPRHDLGEDFVLVGVEGKGMSLQFFQGNALCFFRSREVGSDAGIILQEITRSLVSCQENFPSFRRAPVFLHSDWSEAPDLVPPLKAVFDRDVVLLNPHLERLTPPAGTLTVSQGPSLAAAIGAAERMM